MIFLIIFNIKRNNHAYTQGFLIIELDDQIWNTKDDIRKITLCTCKNKSFITLKTFLLDQI